MLDILSFWTWLPKTPWMPDPSGRYDVLAWALAGLVLAKTVRET